METIKISVVNGEYVCTFSDKKIIALFETDTITTPYPASYPAAKVLKEIAARNPDCVVTIS